MAKRRCQTRSLPPGARPTPSGPRRPAPPPPRRSFPVRLVLVAVAALAGVLFVGATFMSSATATNYTCDEVLPAPTQSVGPEGIATESQGSRHVAAGTKIRYRFCPPTSGDHYAAQGAGPIRPGFYGPDSAAAPGGWVHNLEHGYVVVLYRGSDGLPEDTLAALRRFADTAPQTESAAACGYRSKIVVARFDDMSTPLAVLAWDRLLPLHTWDESAARAFAQRWMDASAPEPRAC